MPDDLRQWAEMMAQHGHVQARQVLHLLRLVEEYRAAAHDFMERWEKVGGKLEIAEFIAKCAIKGGAKRIKELEADLALARRTILELTERVAAQSELLTRRAEKCEVLQS